MEIVKAGTKVRVINSPLYPQYVALICIVTGHYIDNEGIPIYKLRDIMGNLLVGYALREDFEIVE